MPVIGLIGYVDKYDFIMNLSKTINIMGKAVLVVDATLDRKLKYIVPAISGVGRSYVSQYNNIDFAVGFDSMHDVENYMAEQSINISLYDYILVDIDSPKAYEFFRTRGIDNHLFFIHTSVLSVAKNRDIMKAVKIYNTNVEELKITKILYKAYMSRAANEYFNDQIAEYGMKWHEPEYDIPDEEQDKLVNIDSQFSGIIDIKKHTKLYISTIADLAAELMEDVSSRDVMKEIKRRKD